MASDPISTAIARHPSKSLHMVPALQSNDRFLYEPKSDFRIVAGEPGLTFGQPVYQDDSGASIIYRAALLPAGDFSGTAEYVVVGILPGDLYWVASVGFFAYRDFTDYSFPGHGFTVGGYYYTPEAAGPPVEKAALTATQGRQQLFFVHDENTIAINVQQAVAPVTASTDPPTIRVNTFAEVPGANTVTAGTVYIVTNDTNQNTAFYIARGPLGSPGTGWRRR